MQHIPKAGIATLFLGAQDAAPQQDEPEGQAKKLDEPVLLIEQTEEPTLLIEQTEEPTLLDGLHVATDNLALQDYETSGWQEPEKAEQNTILQREK